MSIAARPHKDNAPGRFYVSDDCCTACGIPFAEAPELFAYDNQSQCYVKRQPENKNELNRMIRTVLSAELECIRYGGKDEDVLRRLAERGGGHLADSPISGVVPVSRDHVTFDAIDHSDKLMSESDLVKDFQSFLRSNENDYVVYKFTPILSDGEKTFFSYSWFEDSFHKVEVHFIGLPECRWLIVSDTSFQVFDWLIATEKFCNLRWYSRKQWNTSKEWRETPW